MNPTSKKILSPILAAVIAGGGAFFGIVAELPAGSEISDIRSITWLVILVTAAVAAAKDVRTYFANWPARGQ